MFIFENIQTNSCKIYKIYIINYVTSNFIVVHFRVCYNSFCRTYERITFLVIQAGEIKL